MVERAEQQNPTMFSLVDKPTLTHVATSKMGVNFLFVSGKRERAD